MASPECKRVSILLPEEFEATTESVGPTARWHAGLCDEKAVACLLGEIGELCVIGPHLAPGYWQAPEETAKRYPMLDGVRCCAAATTVASMQRAFCSSTAAAIPDQTQGHRLSPAEVEEEACRLLGVVAAGYVKDEAKDLFCLFVSVSDPSLDEAKIIQALSSKLQPAKVPNRVFCCPNCPRPETRKWIGKPFVRCF